MSVAAEQGIRYGVPMTIFNTVRTLFEAGANAFGVNADIDEMARMYESMANTKFGQHAVTPA